MDCQHKACKCQEKGVRREGKNFCSETCAELATQGRHEGACPCGHPECTAD
jgi:hypothetical protein